MSPNDFYFLYRPQRKPVWLISNSCLFPTKAHLWTAAASLQMLWCRDWRRSQGNTGETETLPRLCLTWPVDTFWCAAFIYLCMFKTPSGLFPFVFLYKRPGTRDGVIKRTHLSKQHLLCPFIKLICSDHLRLLSFILHPIQINKMEPKLAKNTTC